MAMFSILVFMPAVFVIRMTIIPLCRVFGKMLGVPDRLIRKHGPKWFTASPLAQIEIPGFVTILALIVAMSILVLASIVVCGVIQMLKVCWLLPMSVTYSIVMLLSGLITGICVLIHKSYVSDRRRYDHAYKGCHSEIYIYAWIAMAVVSGVFFAPGMFTSTVGFVCSIAAWLWHIVAVVAVAIWAGLVGFLLSIPAIVMANLGLVLVLTALWLVLLAATWFMLFGDAGKFVEAAKPKPSSIDEWADYLTTILASSAEDYCQEYPGNFFGTMGRPTAEDAIMLRYYRKAMLPWLRTLVKPAAIKLAADGEAITVPAAKLVHLTHRLQGKQRMVRQRYSSNVAKTAIAMCYGVESSVWLTIYDLVPGDTSPSYAVDVEVRDSVEGQKLIVACMREVNLCRKQLNEAAKEKKAIAAKWEAMCHKVTDPCYDLISPVGTVLYKIIKNCWIFVKYVGILIKAQKEQACPYFKFQEEIPVEDDGLPEPRKD